MIKALKSLLFFDTSKGLKIPENELLRKDYVQSFKNHESIVKYFNFQNFEDDSKIIRFKDGTNGGILIEIEPLSCEAKPQEYLKEIHKLFYEFVKNSVHECDNPYICQIISYYDNNLTETIESINKYKPKNKFSKVFNKRMIEHIKIIESEKGIFKDGLKNKPWRGKLLRVYMTLYKSKSKSWTKTKEELTDAKERLFSSFKSAGIKHRLCENNDLINLLLPLLTPNLFQIDNINDYIRGIKPKEKSKKLLENMDIGDFVAQAPIKSFNNGIWQTGDKYNVAIPINMLTAEPEIGHLTIERDFAGTRTSLLEQLPTGARWVTTIIFEKQNAIKEHVRYIDKESVGKTKESFFAGEEAKIFYDEIAKKNKAYNVTHTLYLNNTSQEELLTDIKDSSSLLLMNSLPLVDFNQDIYIKDTFIRNLPFNFDLDLDQTKTHRKNLTYADHLACMLPFYGRARGTGNSAVTLFNSGAESIGFDFIKDRLKNAHLDMFGPAGSGKSATLNYLVQCMMASYDLRLVIVDLKWPNPSFGLLLDWFEKCGLNVKRYKYSAKNPVPTPPFKSMRYLFNEKGEYSKNNFKSDNPELDIEGQMLEIAQAMLIEESENLSRDKKVLLNKALILAGKNTYFRKDINYPLVDDLIDALVEMSKDENVSKYEKKILQKMALSMNYFTQGIAGEIFNKAGDGFEDADVVLIELATLTQGTNKDALKTIFMSILQNIQAMAMNNIEGKNTIVVCDETHVVLKHKQIAEYLAIVKKVFRASGIWLWSATQDFADLPEETTKMINNSDWFIGLSMSKPEIKTLNDYKSLTNLQLKQAEICTKEKGKFCEMVLIHTEWSILGRLVLPAIVFATSQTELEERSYRERLMVENNYSDPFDAVLRIEQDIIQSRKNGGETHDSKWN